MSMINDGDCISMCVDYLLENNKKYNDADFNRINPLLVDVFHFLLQEFDNRNNISEENVKVDLFI